MRVNFNKLVGKTIRTHRMQNRLTVEELSTKSNVNRSSITAYENGIHSISLLNLSKIIKIYELDIESVYYFTVDIKKYLLSRTDINFIKLFIDPDNKLFKDLELLELCKTYQNAELYRNNLLDSLPHRVKDKVIKLYQDIIFEIWSVK